MGCSMTRGLILEDVLFAVQSYELGHAWKSGIEVVNF